MVTPETFIDLFRDALMVVLLMVSVIIVPSLIVGLVVAVFQATTSINEQTLSFLPRLIITLLVLMAFGGWLTQTMMDYFFRIIAQLPQVLY